MPFDFEFGKLQTEKRYSVIAFTGSRWDECVMLCYLNTFCYLKSPIPGIIEFFIEIIIR